MRFCWKCWSNWMRRNAMQISPSTTNRSGASLLLTIYFHSSRMKSIVVDRTNVYRFIYHPMVSYTCSFYLKRILYLCGPFSEDSTHRTANPLEFHGKLILQDGTFVDVSLLKKAATHPQEWISSLFFSFAQFHTWNSGKLYTLKAEMKVWHLFLES